MDIQKKIDKLESNKGILLETLLLDKENKFSYLFLDLKDELCFYKGDDLVVFFQKLEKYLKQGFYLAGYFSYEFGYMFEEKLQCFLKKYSGDIPLVWLGVFKKPVSFISSSVNNKLLVKDYKLTNGNFNLNFPEYKKSLRKIKQSIIKGDTYQINFTFKNRFKFKGNACGLYSYLKSIQPTAYGAFINNGSGKILSFSPELFFRRKQKQIMVKPMKGTMKRGSRLQQDKKLKEKLRQSVKDQAENIMIVDLLRNDLGKIAEKGSVKTEELFKIESYPTLFQMISVVTAKLQNKVKWLDIFKALFPSGSVIGAPKISSMEIIKRREEEPRGVYTGCIGYIAPNNQACFNVAIRTLMINKSKAQMGIGSGIVYDSTAKKEYQESLLKSKFLNDS